MNTFETTVPSEHRPALPALPPRVAVPERFLRLPTVLALLGVSRATLYRWVADGRFVKPYHLSERLVAWKASEVTQWIEGRCRAG